MGIGKWGFLEGHAREPGHARFMVSSAARFFRPYKREGEGEGERERERDGANEMVNFNCLLQSLQSINQSVCGSSSSNSSRID